MIIKWMTFKWIDRTRALSSYANLGYAKICLKDAWLSISSSARFRHDFLCTTLRTRPAGMNTSSRPSYPQEGIMGNSTWNSPFYQTNFTLSPPLLPKTKAAACDQLHIAIEVWIVITFCMSIIAFIDYVTSCSSDIPFVTSCLLLSGLSDPGHHLPIGEHPGHHGYREEQKPALSHVLLCLQVNVSLKALTLVDNSVKELHGACICCLLQFFPKCGSFLNPCDLLRPAII